MLASVIVTSYNDARFLAAAIDSALGQTYRDIEVIVVDDGSTDGSRAIIEGYGHSVVPVFKATNGGQASALNAGFAVSRGDMVFLLDSDDYFVPQKLARMIEHWSAQPESALAYHQLRTIDAEGRLQGHAWPASTWTGDISARITASGGWWPRPTTSGLCFRRCYLERVLPMPTGPRIWADTYLAPPAGLSGPVVGVREPLAFYRLHEHNTMSAYFPRPGASAAERRVVARRRVEQFTFEHQLLHSCLPRVLAQPPALSLDGHPEFQAARLQADDGVSLGRVVSLMATSPAIPWAMRLRQIANVLLETAGYHQRR
jgi:glycosyltransferase involved in cell wall biosynthesis